MAAPTLAAPPTPANRARRPWRRRTLQLTMIMAAIVLLAIAMVTSA